MRKNPSCKNTKKQADHGLTGDQFCHNLLVAIPSPLPLDQAITFPSQGNHFIFSTRCRSVGKISINFAPVASVNAKTSHRPECGWLTSCQPWLYDWLKPLRPHPPQQQAIVSVSHNRINGDNRGTFAACLCPPICRQGGGGR
jgi:hypothetical protein